MKKIYFTCFVGATMLMLMMLNVVSCATCPSRSLSFESLHVGNSHTLRTNEYSYIYEVPQVPLLNAKQSAVVEKSVASHASQLGLRPWFILVTVNRTASDGFKFVDVSVFYPPMNTTASLWQGKYANMSFTYPEGSIQPLFDLNDIVIRSYWKAVAPSRQICDLSYPTAMPFDVTGEVDDDTILSIVDTLEQHLDQNDGFLTHIVKEDEKKYRVHTSTTRAFMAKHQAVYFLEKHEGLHPEIRLLNNSGRDRQDPFNLKDFDYNDSDIKIEILSIPDDY